MRGLTFAFLVLSSYCDALRLPGGTFDLSSASPTGIVDIFQQSESVLFVLTSSFAESRLTSIVRAPYLLNITALLNSTEHILGLPIQPSVYRQLRPCCGTYSTPPSKGGQLIYSLLSELSELWKSTDNPILLEPVHVRNVPFYSIDFTVVPVRSSRNLLTRTKLAVYLYQLVQNLVRINFGASRWPGRVSCNLTVVPDGLTIGKMDVAMIPITTLGSESRSTEHNVSSHSNITGTAWEIASKGNLRADGIDVHQVFMGTGTTDRNALYLFTKLLCPLFHRPRELRVTTFVPPGELTREIKSSDGTFGIRMQTYRAGYVWEFTVEEMHEGLMRLLLLCALADRWGSMIGDIFKDGRAVASVYLDLAHGSSAEGSGQNWTA